ncbi:unnamed protein product [Rotaria sp. Silwood1]|nr:unnamed protein product [Rotaria sp. Silwood1]
MKEKSIILSGDQLTLEDVVSIARYYRKVQLTDNKNVKSRMNTSIDVISNAVDQRLPLYGVTTQFGGLATQTIEKYMYEELQSNLIAVFHMDTGPSLPLEVVRAAMVLRVNSHLIGASGIRRIWNEYMIIFLMNNVTPLVP